MTKTNCWDFKKCGREIGGLNVKELGICPAATYDKADGFCGGINGGRACVFISGTLCSGHIKGTFKDKPKECYFCDFYKILKKEHGLEFTKISFSEYLKNKVDFEF